MQGLGLNIFFFGQMTFFLKKKRVTNDTSFTRLQPRCGWKN